MPLFGAPAAASAAFAAISDTMRLEFEPLGIRVTLIEPGAIKTEIFEKAARASALAYKEESPELVEAYCPAIDAMRKLFLQGRADKPEIVVDAVMRALDPSAPPRARVLVGRGSAMFALLAMLPAQLRDRAVTRALGMKKPLAATARSLAKIDRPLS